MWSFSQYLPLSCLLPTLVTSLALAPANDAGASLTLTNPSSQNLPPVPVLTADNKNSSLLSAGERHVKCESSLYGHPSVASCQDAFDVAPHYTRWFITNPVLTFGRRGTGNWDFNLPNRYISCAWFGACGFVRDGLADLWC